MNSRPTQRGAAYGVIALVIFGVALLVAGYFWAVLSWNYIETPALRIKQRYSRND